MTYGVQVLILAFQTQFKKAVISMNRRLLWLVSCAVVLGCSDNPSGPGIAVFDVGSPESEADGVSGTLDLVAPDLGPSPSDTQPDDDNAQPDTLANNYGPISPTDWIRGGE